MKGLNFKNLLKNTVKQTSDPLPTFSEYPVQPKISDIMLQVLISVAHFFLKHACLCCKFLFNILFFIWSGFTVFSDMQQLYCMFQREFFPARICNIHNACSRFGHFGTTTGKITCKIGVSHVEAYLGPNPRHQQRLGKDL